MNKISMHNATLDSNLENVEPEGVLDMVHDT